MEAAVRTDAGLRERTKTKTERMLAILTDGKLCKTNPSNQEEMIRRVSRCALTSEPLRLFFYWGGNKDTRDGIADEADRLAMERISKVKAELGQIHPTEASIIFCDIHAASLNLINVYCINRYLKSIKEMAEKHGIKVEAASKVCESLPRYERFKARVKRFLRHFEDGLYDDEQRPLQEARYLAGEIAEISQECMAALETQARKHSMAYGVLPTKDICREYVGMYSLPFRAVEAGHPDALHVVYGNPIGGIVGSHPVLYWHPFGRARVAPWRISGKKMQEGKLESDRDPEDVRRMRYWLAERYKQLKQDLKVWVGTTVFIGLGFMATVHNGSFPPKHGNLTPEEYASIGGTDEAYWRHWGRIPEYFTRYDVKELRSIRDLKHMGAKELVRQAEERRAKLRRVESGVIWYYRSALDRDPNSIELHMALHDLYGELGDYYSARVHLLKASKLLHERKAAGKISQ